MPNLIAQTPRIIIREYSPNEEEAFITLLTDPRVTAYIPNRNWDENAKIFKDTLADYSNGIAFSRWGIFDAITQNYIGMGMLKAAENEPGTAELGYVIHDAYKGNGIATELSHALLNYGFAEKGLSKIFAVTVKENKSSQQVLLKAGLTPGDDLFRNGLWLAYFKIKASDWRKQQTAK